MPRFRPPLTADATVGQNPKRQRGPDLTGGFCPAVHTVRRLAEEVFCPAHFFAAPTLALGWEHVEVEEVAWEVFRGRLLDPAHTRQRRSFTSWSIYQVDGQTRSAEPLLSVKLDESRGQIHVVRAILSHVWVGFDAGDNVIESRETNQWV